MYTSLRDRLWDVGREVLRCLGCLVGVLAFLVGAGGLASLVVPPRHPAAIVGTITDKQYSYTVKPIAYYYKITVSGKQYDVGEYAYDLLKVGDKVEIDFDGHGGMKVIRK